MTTTTNKPALTTIRRMVENAASMTACRTLHPLDVSAKYMGTREGVDTFILSATFVNSRMAPYPSHRKNGEWEWADVTYDVNGVPTIHLHNGNPFIGTRDQRPMIDDVC